MNSINSDIYGYHESILISEMEYKDIMIESLTDEFNAYLIENKTDARVNRTLNTLKNFFSKIINLLISLAKGIKNMLSDTVRKMKDRSNRLERYYKVNKNSIKEGLKYIPEQDRQIIDDSNITNINNDIDRYTFTDNKEDIQADIRLFQSELQNMTTKKDNFRTIDFKFIEYTVKYSNNSIQGLEYLMKETKKPIQIALNKSQASYKELKSHEEVDSFRLQESRKEVSDLNMLINAITKYYTMRISALNNQNNAIVSVCKRAVTAYKTDGERY